MRGFHLAVFLSLLFLAAAEKICLPCPDETEEVENELPVEEEEKPVQFELDLDDVDPECAEEGDVRLVDGPNLTEGRAEMFVDGQWGSICDSPGYSTPGWPTVFCTQLLGQKNVRTGYVADKAIFVRDHPSKLMAAPQGLPISFHVPDCFPNEAASMRECGQNRNTGATQCERNGVFFGHEWDVWIKC